MESQRIERSFMQAAIDEMKKAERSPKVGAVVVIGEDVVSTGHKQVGIHAERAAIQVALDCGVNLKGATLYTTLEPCVNSGNEQSKKCCADFIIQNGIQEVFIGRYDPNSVIYRKGWKRLRDAGIKCKDFPRDLREVLDAENSRFMDHFKVKTGPKGGAKLDHKDGATLRVQFSSEDHRYIDIGWTLRGAGSVYGYAVPPVEVALARYANDFDDVDDPTAYEFKHSVAISVGEIGIFRGLDGCVLVKPTEVQSGPDHGEKDYFVKFDFEVRLPSQP